MSTVGVSEDVQRGEDRETSSSENNGNEAAVGTVAASVDLKASVPGGSDTVFEKREAHFDWSMVMQGSTRYWNYLEDYWPGADKFSAVNAIGTPPSTPALGTSMGADVSSAALDAAATGGSTNPDAPFLLPESGFVSPMEGVPGNEGGDHYSEGFLSGRPYSRKSIERRDEMFKRRLKQHRQKDMLFELMEDGTYEMKYMSIREVFNYVQECVFPYALATMASPPRTPEKHASLTSLPVPPGSRPESRQPSLNNVRPSRDASFSGGHRMKRSFSNPGGGVSMSSLNLHLRDLRQLFSSQSKSEPAISVRRNCILVNFETLRGIVLVDRLLLVVDPGADSILLEVRKALSGSGDGVYEFELKALESLLSISSKCLEKEVREVESPIEDFMNIFTGTSRAATSAENNDRFRMLANEISVLESRAKARRRALQMALGDDTDLAMMNLTRMCQSPEDYLPPLSKEVLDDHEEIELLLEAYLQDINSVINVVELLQGRARSTEALLMVKLDIARNRILTAGLVFSMVSTCFTLGTLVSGIFGMNLSSGLESNQLLFKIVAIGTVGICVVAFCIVFVFFYRKGLLVT